MNAYIGNGWYIRHLTDRTIGLVKPSVAYRQVQGGMDGAVFVRTEPGTDRTDLVKKGIAMAQREDAALADIIARQMVPDRRRFDAIVARIEPAFETPEDPKYIGMKGVRA